MNRVLELLILLVLCLPVGTGQASTQPGFGTTGTAAVQANQGNPDVKVWVNTASSVYHCPGTRWYGSTKRGKYLGECAAIKDGNRPAYGKACGSDCQSALIREPASSPTDKENTAPTTNPQA